MDKYIGYPSMPLLEAMQQIDAGARGILYVVDDEGHLLGSLTDGDIRRYILRTGGLTGTVEAVMNRSVRFIYEGEIQRAEQVMQELHIRSLPVVDTDGCAVSILFEEDEPGEKLARTAEKSDIPVIIMAGGKGTRLYPYTKILPKPLIPIGDVPIIERIMNRFHQNGFDEFYITINYRKEMIKAYFVEQELPYNIHLIEEELPLGTAGSIRLIREQFDTPVFVTNCDILIDVDLHHLVSFHRQSHNDITVVASMQNTQIPYGVLHTREHGLITSMEEKPKLSYLINTGMYLVEPELFHLIPERRMFHMTDLVEEAMRQSRRAGIYPIGESAYLDMGQFEEMKKMEERVNNEGESQIIVSNKESGLSPMPEI